MTVTLESDQLRLKTNSTSAILKCDGTAVQNALRSVLANPDNGGHAPFAGFSLTVKWERESFNPPGVEYRSAANEVFMIPWQDAARIALMEDV